MIKVVSESDKRLIVKGTFNSKSAYMLIDTGATVGLIDKHSEKKYCLSINKSKCFQIEGAGGGFKAYLVNTPFEIGNKQVYQFLLADISNVVRSIEKETGIKIAGLISLSQCKMLNISIDTDDNYLTIGD